MADECGETTNPFLISVRPWVSSDEWRRYLYANPLRGVNWKEMPLHERERLLDSRRRFHYPSSDTLRLARSLQSDVHATLTARDPRRPENVVATNRLVLEAGLTIPDDHSIFHSSGGATVMGDSGLGKSSSIRAILRVIFPRQSFDYGSTLEPYGIARLLQISYLIIEFNEDGSAWTLITAICRAIDAIAKTTHERSIKNARNAESALDDVIRILKAHNVIVMVFDELQKDSLKKRGRGPDLISYFKKLMNMGIAVILAGNPEAFDRVKKSLQLMRRFSTMGLYEPLRGFGEKPEQWMAFVDGMMTYRVVDAIEDPNSVAEELSLHCGMTQDFLSQLWVEAQRVALRRGGDSVTLTVEDVRSAQSSEEYESTRATIAKMAPGPGKTSPFEDLTPLPINLNQHQWGANDEKEDPAPPLRAVPDSVRNLSSAKKRADRKRAQNEEADEEAKNLEGDDLRRLLRGELPTDVLGFGPQGAFEL